jgi:hypothetical protein
MCGTAGKREVRWDEMIKANETLESDLIGKLKR